jgi:protein SCO1/2
VTRRLLLVLLAVAVLAAGCSSGSGSKAEPTDLIGQNQVGSFQGEGLSTPQPRPSFTLTDTAGKSFAFGTLTAKHPTLLYFGYTQCPDVCPETMADVRQALAKVPAAVAKQTYVVFVSTDVKHDTAPIITQWLSNFDDGSMAHWVGLRGTQAQIDTAQAAAHVTVAEDGGETHSASILLYGPDDYARVVFLPTDTEAGQIAHDLPIVAKGTS